MDGGQYHNMNGDVPNIPVITLAGITSLTDLLPELPVPGPAPSGSQTLGSNLLYHASIAQEANQYLSMPNENLTTRIGEALANTPFENYQIHPLSATDQITPLHHTSVLANYVIRNNPNVFQYQSQWNSMNSHYQNLNSEQYIDPQQHHLQQHQQQMQHQHQSLGLNQTQHAADVFPTPAPFQQLNNRGHHSSQHETKPEVKSIGGHEEAGRASKVEEVLHTKVKVEEKPSVPRENKHAADDKDSKSSRLSRSSSKKNDDQGGQTSSNSGSASSRPKRSNNPQTKYQDTEGENTDDDTDEEEDAKKGSRKFFKATEKEREDERRKLKDERRKRKLEDADFKGSEDEKRRRKDSPQRSPSPEVFVPKVITKKIERKLVPVIPKLDVDELMNSNIFLKFNKTVELIFDNLEEVNMDEFLNGDNEEGGDLPSEILIPKYQLQDLANETAKLKSMGVTDSIPAEKITKLLGILELNIRDGSKVSPIAGDEDEDEDADKLWLELTMERVMRAADSSLTVLNILTSKGMGKVVYLEDVIDRVALFIRFQLSNTIYPSYDPVYKEMSRSKTGYVGSMKKKRSYAHQVRDKNILGLYNKVTELVSLFGELVRIQLLTDTTVLHISTLGVAPFFVENVAELQLAALRLVTNVFSKYENHRRLLLDDILASIARLPSSKRSLRTYRLNANSHIQMLTALVLQLIQCVVVLPRHLASDDSDPASKAKNASNINPLEEEEYSADMDKDVLINSKYSMAMATAHQFLTVFLKKCGSKNEDIDYRPLFENFVQDLLTTVNIPEWPAAELILSLLGHVLREKFKEKSTEMALRNSSLEYLGVVAARLRKDVVQSKNKVDYIDSIIKLIKDEEEKESGETPSKSKKKKSKELKDPEEERTRFLQRVLLDYLAVNGGETDHATMNARHFYICQWYRDANASTKKAKKAKKTNQTNNNTTKKNNRKRRKDSSSESSEEEDPEEDDSDEDEDEMSEAKKAELYRIREDRKKFLVAKILPFGSDRGQRAQVLSTHIDHESAHLIVKYLSSKRPFFNSFNSYLQDILNVLSENSTHVRTKALKCMAMIVAEDPEVLLRHDMQTGVQYSFMDSSTMVREAAVDLLGKYILHNQDLITQYYKIITDRILDTGVSVRKRVIKILKDICLGFPQYDKIPEICVKMIRRINDEEGIRKLVMEVFQNMWFIPIRDKKRTSEDEQLLLTRARNITDVVVACHDTGLEWFEQLLQTLFRPKEDKEDATIKNTEPPPQLVLACQQIVDCLVESVLRMEESSFDMTNGEHDGSKNTNSSLGSNPRIVACLTTLYLFAKIRAQFLVEHVQTLQPYLSVVCKTKGDYQIIADVARTLELVVPLLKHPSEIFMAQLEEDNVRLMLQHDRKVVMACVSCLGSIVNEVTKNYGLVRDCFTKLYSQMTQYRNYYERNPKDPRLDQVTPKFRRSMFTVGLLLKHFDFSNPDVYTGLEGGDVTVDEVFETTLFFILHHTPQIQLDTLNSLGFICIRHHDFMVQSKLKQIYIDILTEDFYSVLQKIKVLNNIEQFLIEEEIRMIKMDKHWRDYADKENLKEMGDVSSGMASTVVQSFISGILESLLNPDLGVRHAAIKVVSLIHNQGLIHPINFVPYLMCASTDIEQKLAHTADRELQEIEKKYPGFVYMKHLQGIKLSFKLQQTLQNGSNIVRGFRQKEGELPSALSGFIYSILKTTKAQRRGILNGLLKQFDDTAKSSLTMMLYLADNLAYIPYTVLDEPLYVIHHIDIMISVSGSNLLQTFKECLRPPPSCEKIIDQETGKVEYVYDEDLDDDFESVYSRLPEDCKTLQEAITASQGCMLLLVLKEHLKDLYGLNASKITQYSPADNNKAYERQVNRRANVQFDPRATLEILRLGDPPEVLADVHKRDLVKKYLQFKELMNKIDPDDEEEDLDDTGASSANPSPVKQNSSKANHITPSKHNKRNQETDDYNPGGSSRQSQHLAYIQVQNQDQNSRPRPSRAAAVAANAAVSASNNSDAMVLDPVPGDYLSGNNYYDNGGNYGNANDVHMVNSKQAFMNHGQLKHSKSSLQGSGRDISKHSDDGRGKPIKNSHHKKQHRTSSRR